jgi:peptide/nickel transport system permease protein
MARFIFRRILTMIPVVLGISFIIFSIMALTPGDPAQIILGDGADQAAIDALREEMGLNDFFVLRYIRYIAHALSGDLGLSYRTRLPVLDELMLRLPNTMILALFGVGCAAMIGVPIGIISAVRQYTLLDSVTRSFAMIMTAIPAFWLGLMLMLLFSLRLGWLPAIGADTWKGFVLPSATLAIGNMAVMIRMTRSTMLEVIREDYIRTALAKGASHKRVILRHALANALLPIITTIGLNFGLQMGGAMICETVFSIPGLGTLIITSVRQKDVPMVMASVIFVSLTISVVTLAMDLVYSYLDPRVKIHNIRKARA